jgi:hypothetical protein
VVGRASDGGMTMRLAFRSLRRSPAYAATSIGTIALTIPIGIPQSGNIPSLQQSSICQFNQKSPLHPLLTVNRLN